MRSQRSHHRIFTPAVGARTVARGLAAIGLSLVFLAGGVSAGPAGLSLGGNSAWAQKQPNDNRSNNGGGNRSGESRPKDTDGGKGQSSAPGGSESRSADGKRSDGLGKPDEVEADQARRDFEKAVAAAQKQFEKAVSAPGADVTVAQRSLEIALALAAAELQRAVARDSDSGDVVSPDEERALIDAGWNN